MSEMMAVLEAAMRADADALRAIDQRDSTATVYLSSDLVPACRYYLAWHSDRRVLGGGVDAARADIRTARARRTNTDAGGLTGVHFTAVVEIMTRDFGLILKH